ncbi:hypothetical protein [Pseudalkalibacillus caeni]|nr:hypothetical protein [Pseudalkalibacillus caeni]
MYIQKPEQPKLDDVWYDKDSGYLFRFNGEYWIKFVENNLTGNGKSYIQ